MSTTEPTMLGLCAELRSKVDTAIGLVLSLSSMFPRRARQLVDINHHLNKSLSATDVFIARHNEQSHHEDDFSILFL